MDLRPNIRSKVIKLLGMKTEQKLYNTDLSNDLDMVPKAQEMKKITNWTSS